MLFASIRSTSKIYNTIYHCTTSDNQNSLFLLVTVHPRMTNRQWVHQSVNYTSSFSIIRLISLLKLDSMCWFSQRHRSGRRHNCITYLSTPRTAPEKMPHFFVFIPSDLDLWPWHSNSGEIFVQCTYSPSFIFLHLIIRKLFCWQTDKQTDIAENIHLAPLCYAGG